MTRRPLLFAAANLRKQNQPTGSDETANTLGVGPYIHIEIGARVVCLAKRLAWLLLLAALPGVWTATTDTFAFGAATITAPANVPVVSGSGPPLGLEQPLVYCTFPALVQVTRGQARWADLSCHDGMLTDVQITVTWALDPVPGQTPPTITPLDWTDAIIMPISSETLPVKIATDMQTAPGSYTLRFAGATAPGVDVEVTFQFVATIQVI